MIPSLLKFLSDSPVNFLAAKNVCNALDYAGFKHLDPRRPWQLQAGDRCYVTKNGSAVMAFIVGNGGTASPFHIISAHTDSPGFRIKPNAEMTGEGDMVRLNTEVYGGPILYTWFDRPLSVAGRVILRSDDPLNPRTVTVDLKEPLMIIPHLAIHFNRAVNDGNPLSRQRDMLPVMGRIDGGGKGYIKKTVARHLNVAEDEILDYDLSLYDPTPAQTFGVDGQFINCGRIDDLSMVHAAYHALIATANETTASTRVIALFDNEETGSGTKQGAASPILADTLERITLSLGGNHEDYLRAVAASFMVSADNAHGLHPNYVDKQDPTNHPLLGGGPVVKINANCKYMTDADSAAVFAEVCRLAGVPVQYFVNHSDVAGGSTLGNILTSQIPLRGVDMGEAIWAMHSCRETSSAVDHVYTIKAFKQFFTL